MTTRGGETYVEELGLQGLTASRPSRASVPPGMATTTQALRRVTSRLLNLLLDEFLDRPTPPGPLWPAKESADRWT